MSSNPPLVTHHFLNTRIGAHAAVATSVRPGSRRRPARSPRRQRGRCAASPRGPARLAGQIVPPNATTDPDGYPYSDPLQATRGDRRRLSRRPRAAADDPSPRPPSPSPRAPPRESVRPGPSVITTALAAEQPRRRPAPARRVPPTRSQPEESRIQPRSRHRLASSPGRGNAAPTGHGGHATFPAGPPARARRHAGPTPNRVRWSPSVRFVRRPQAAPGRRRPSAAVQDRGNPASRDRHLPGPRSPPVPAMTLGPAGRRGQNAGRDLCRGPRRQVLRLLYGLRGGHGRDLEPPPTPPAQRLPARTTDPGEPLRPARRPRSRGTKPWPDA